MSKTNISAALRNSTVIRTAATALAAAALLLVIPAGVVGADPGIGWGASGLGVLPGAGWGLPGPALI